MSFFRNWRYLLLSMVAIGALAGFAACGDDDEGGGAEETPGDGGSPAAGERIDGGEMTVHAIEPQSLDPHFSQFRAGHLLRALDLARTVQPGHEQ